MEINNGSDNQTFDTGISTTNQGFVKRECEVCGEEYTTLQALANIGRNRCRDCDTNRLNAPRNPFGNDRPLMEYGPLSHG